MMDILYDWFYVEEVTPDPTSRRCKYLTCELIKKSDKIKLKPTGFFNQCGSPPGNHHIQKTHKSKKKRK